MTSTPDAPSSFAARIKTSLRLSFVAIILYSILKLIVFSLELTIPVLSSPSDPVLGILLIIVGLNWIAFGVYYFIQSTQSKKFSAMYASLLDSDEEYHDDFKTGKQTAKKHQLRAIFAIFTGAIMLAIAAGFLFLVLS